MDDTLSEQETSAVLDIVARQLDVARDQVTPDASLMRDLGADSLDVFEIAIQLEEHFDFTIPDGKWDEVDTVADLLQAVVSLRSGIGGKP